MTGKSLKEWLRDNGGIPEGASINGIHVDQFGSGKKTLTHALAVFEEGCLLAREQSLIVILAIELDNTAPLREACSVLDLQDRILYPPLLHLLQPAEVGEFWRTRFREVEREECDAEKVREVFLNSNESQDYRLIKSLELERGEAQWKRLFVYAIYTPLPHAKGEDFAPRKRG